RSASSKPLRPPRPKQLRTEQGGPAPHTGMLPTSAGGAAEVSPVRKHWGPGNKQCQAPEGRHISGTTSKTPPHSPKNVGAPTLKVILEGFPVLKITFELHPDPPSPLHFFHNSPTPTLRCFPTCGIQFSPACASRLPRVFPYNSFQAIAPTFHACPRNGSHHSQDLRAGRGRSPGQFSGPHFGSHAGSSRRRAPYQEPLRLHAGTARARAALLCRTRNARPGSHPAGRVARVLQQVSERL